MILMRMAISWRSVEFDDIKAPFKMTNQSLMSQMVN